MRARPTQRLLQAALLLMAAMLCGCASLGAPPPSNSTPPRAPLSAASLGRTRSAQQIVRAAFGDKEATMQCAVDVGPERVQVIALNAVGLRLFSVKAENGQSTVERAPGVPEQIQPEQILRDIQFCYWPLAALQAGFRGTAWEVSEPFAGTRRLKRDGRLIAEVHYSKPGSDPWGNRLWLANFEYGYSLAVEPAPADNE
jgi:hypothetical protein